VKYKITLIIFYIFSTDHNNLWSVLFIINKQDKFLNQISNINKLKITNFKILYSANEIDNNIKSWLQNTKYFALIIWDHKLKNEINKSFSQELSSKLSSLNKKINILCLDFCYSASLQIILNLTDYVEYIIANQDKQFMDGFCYENLFNTEMNAKEIAQQIVIQTCNHYKETDKFNLINLVAIDCNKINLLRPFLNKLDKIKFNQLDLFVLLQKKFYHKHAIKYLLNSIIIAQGRTGNYQSLTGISI